MEKIVRKVILSVIYEALHYLFFIFIKHKQQLLQVSKTKCSKKHNLINTVRQYEEVKPSCTNKELKRKCYINKQ